MDFTVLSKVLLSKNIKNCINSVISDRNFIIYNAINDFLSKKNILLCSLINLKIIYKLLEFFVYRIIFKKDNYLSLFNYLTNVVLYEIEIEMSVKKNIIKKLYKDIENFSKKFLKTNDKNIIYMISNIINNIFIFSGKISNDLIYWNMSISLIDFEINELDNLEKGIYYEKEWFYNFIRQKLTNIDLIFDKSTME